MLAPRCIVHAFECGREIAGKLAAKLRAGYARCTRTFGTSSALYAAGLPRCLSSSHSVLMSLKITAGCR